MITPPQLEESYDDFVQNFKKWAPDGIIEIDLEGLCEMGLVNREDFDDEEDEDD